MCRYRFRPPITILFLILLVAVSTTGVLPASQEESTTSDRSEATSSPLEIVNQRMQAYNDHDIEAFLSTYSEDIEIFNYPNQPIGRKGKAHIRSIFEPLFEEGEIGVTIHRQIVQGAFVINEETVTQAGKEIRYVSIYEVHDGLIQNVRFLRE